jgi:hypothetical protein
MTESSILWTEYDHRCMNDGERAAFDAEPRRPAASLVFAFCYLCDALSRDYPVLLSVVDCTGRILGRVTRLATEQVSTWNP